MKKRIVLIAVVVCAIGGAVVYMANAHSKEQAERIYQARAAQMELDSIKRSAAREEIRRLTNRATTRPILGSIGGGYYIYISSAAREDIKSLIPATLTKGNRKLKERLFSGTITQIDLQHLQNVELDNDHMAVIEKHKESSIAEAKKFGKALAGYLNENSESYDEWYDETIKFSSELANALMEKRRQR